VVAAAAVVVVMAVVAAVAVLAVVTLMAMASAVVKVVAVVVSAVVVEAIAAAVMTWAPSDLLDVVNLTALRRLWVVRVGRRGGGGGAKGKRGERGAQRLHGTLESVGDWRRTTIESPAVDTRVWDSEVCRSGPKRCVHGGGDGLGSWTFFGGLGAPGMGLRAFKEGEETGNAGGDVWVYVD
jgi:hypothetical protein